MGAKHKMFKNKYVLVEESQLLNVCKAWRFYALHHCKSYWLQMATAHLDQDFPHF